MGFLIRCDNKGCYKEQNALLDLATKEVHCVECSKIIKNVTIFTKRQMESLGQVKKNKTAQSFSVKCGACEFQGTPKLIDKTVCCTKCDVPVKISKPFEKLIKDYLK